jgi:hypothetical protein
LAEYDRIYSGLKNGTITVPEGEDCGNHGAMLAMSKASSSWGCYACKYGLMAVIAVPVGLLMATGIGEVTMAAVSTVAAATGLSTAVVEGLFSGAAYSGLDAAMQALCTSMGSC